jgi:hypothetical protein
MQKSVRDVNEHSVGFGFFVGFHEEQPPSCIRRIIYQNNSSRTGLRIAKMQKNIAK